MYRQKQNTRNIIGENITQRTRNVDQCWINAGPASYNTKPALGQRLVFTEYAFIQFYCDMIWVVCK